MGARQAASSVGNSAAATALVERLRSGDEGSFVALVDQYQAAMLRMARIYTSDNATAEEVVQETWLAVIQGIEQFEKRSSLKTWIFRILFNQARKRCSRENRTIPFAAMFKGERASEAHSVDADRFLPADHPLEPGHWALAPTNWGPNPEERLLLNETLTYVQRSIDTLPENQKEVVVLRDVSGWTSGEVCELLGISEANQRVLLHRARSKIRSDLERYLDNEGIYTDGR